jgi:hypothetical protein
VYYYLQPIQQYFHAYGAVLQRDLSKLNDTKGNITLKPPPLKMKDENNI